MIYLKKKTLINPAISRKIAQVLFNLNAGIWGILGFVCLLRIPQSFPNMGITGWINAILMFNKERIYAAHREV